MASRSKSSIFLHVVEEEQCGMMDIRLVTQGTKKCIENARRPGTGSMMRLIINEESDFLRKKKLLRLRC
jgi:hypothetical protein